MLSEAIKARLAERFSAPLPEFHKRRIVFWNDENGEFSNQLDDVSLPGVTLIKLNGRNNFAVKKRLTVDDLTGDYLVYNPIVYDKPQDNWFWDVELYSGEPFLADLVSTQMEELNVESSPAMRKTMKLYAKFFSVERKKKLKRISRSYQTPLQLHLDIMAVLCGLNGGTAQDVIAAVLTAGLERDKNSALENIAKFGSIDAFRQVVQRFTGYTDADDRPLGEFAAHILISALSQTMSAGALRGLERFISEPCTAFCYQFVHEWQYGEKSSDLIEICRYVERELRLADRFDKVELDVLLKSDIFPVINERILKRLYTEVCDHVIKVDDILTAVEKRRTAGWFSLTADYFDCLLNIAKMQEFYLAHIEGFHIVEPKRIWEFYTDKGYLMDSHYRHYHFAFGNTLKAPDPTLDELLKKSANVVEGLYYQWYLKELTAAWANAIAEDMKILGYVSEIKRQREFYGAYVDEDLKESSQVFVIISDALRYEVAAELADTLRRTTKGDVHIQSVQTIFPGITKFGIPALLPGKVMSVNEKLEVLLDGKPTDTTEFRGKLISAANEKSEALTYKEFLQMSPTQFSSSIKGKKIISIYHNTIDAVGEKAVTEMKVFGACKDAIDELRGIVFKILGERDSAKIIITSDHGFLYTYKPLDESQKINSQTFDGEVYELGRRYALVPPETTADYLMPVNMEREIDGLPMKGYAPQDTIRIKVQGGGSNYVHGGISLQEMTVPVVTLKGMRKVYKDYVEVENPGLSLISESRKLSNLMFSLDFMQKKAVEGKVQPCVYTLYFIGEEDAVISDKQTVIADKTSINASDRVFRVRFNLKSIAFDRNRIYRLVITSNTDKPEETEFHIDIALADDFGFDL